MKNRAGAFVSWENTTINWQSLTVPAAAAGTDWSSFVLSSSGKTPKTIIYTVRADRLCCRFAAGEITHSHIGLESFFTLLIPGQRH